MSPAIIDLVLGEPLLIEVSASGGYTRISWTRNGAALSGSFVSHDEVYYTATTTSVDLGAYSITAAGGGPTVTVAVLVYSEYFPVAEMKYCIGQELIEQVQPVRESMHVSQHVATLCTQRNSSVAAVILHLVAHTVLNNSRSIVAPGRYLLSQLLQIS